MLKLSDFWANGVAIVRGVFSPGEVSRARECAAAHDGEDMLTVRELRAIMLDERVLSIARTVLGSDELVYFGDSNAMVGETAPGFHRDNADKADGAAPDWIGRYPLIRFGLYTRDHSSLPGGLDVRVGSHLDVAERGSYVAADTREGDLVLWNLRTLHSGSTMRMLTGAPVDPSTVIGKVLRRWPMGLLREADCLRIAMFWTFGVPGPHLERYIAYLKTRTYAVDRWLAASYDADALREAASSGVSVRNVRDELDGLDRGALHEDHVPIAY